MHVVAHQLIRGANVTTGPPLGLPLLPLLEILRLPPLALAGLRYRIGRTELPTGRTVTRPSHWRAEHTMHSNYSRISDSLTERLTATETAAFLRVSETDVIRWLEAGALPGYKLPDRWLIMRDELTEHLTQNHNSQTTTS